MASFPIITTKYYWTNYFACFKPLNHTMDTLFFAHQNKKPYHYQLVSANQYPTVFYFVPWHVNRIK